MILNRGTVFPRVETARGPRVGDGYHKNKTIMIYEKNKKEALVRALAPQLHKSVMIL